MTYSGDTGLKFDQSKLLLRLISYTKFDDGRMFKLFRSNTVASHTTTVQSGEPNKIKSRAISSSTLLDNSE